MNNKHVILSNAVEAQTFAVVVQRATVEEYLHLYRGNFRLLTAQHLEIAQSQIRVYVQAKVLVFVMRIHIDEHILYSYLLTIYN